MTKTEQLAVELAAKGTTNLSFSRTILLGALTSAVIVLPHHYVERTGFYKGCTNCTSGTLQSYTSKRASEGTFIPKTALGKKLYELRQRVISSGVALLSPAEIILEVQRRRDQSE